MIDRWPPSTTSSPSTCPGSVAPPRCPARRVADRGQPGRRGRSAPWTSSASSAYHVAGYSLGARVAIQLAESDRVRSVIAIAPDGLGTPVERLQGFIALVAGRGVAMALAPVAGC